MKKVVPGAVVVTLVTTPWVSSDALIIPKIIAITILSAYLLPSLIGKVRISNIKSKTKLLLILSILFVIQMIIVSAMSESPLEQQFFGQTGRGLGFLTYFSLIVIMIYVAKNINNNDLSKICLGLLLSCGISSIYSILQFLGVDFYDWQTNTNGIIGTIGNPNFQSSFVAIAFVPSMFYLWSRKNRLILTPVVSAILLFTLYICESTQGYIALSVSIMSFILIYCWYKSNKLIFYTTLILTAFSGLIVICGMLNKGPLSYYLYKVSVRSRGEMWQTATAMIRKNPVFGVGLDSFGDYSLKYRSEKTANGIGEYIDNCHNFFLQFAATGGVLLALTYLGIILLSFYCFVTVQRQIGKFDASLTALFTGWISFQLQSLISPAAIPTLLWNFIICGTFIGLASNFKLNNALLNNRDISNTNNQKNPSISIFGLAAAILSMVITFPLFNADKLAREADINKDANLAVKAAKTYPESVIRYNHLGAKLYESGLYDLSLDVARSAIKFNSNSYQTWILLLVNPSATLEERRKAKEALIKIDPFNKVLKNYRI